MNRAVWIRRCVKRNECQRVLVKAESVFSNSQTDYVRLHAAPLICLEGSVQRQVWAVGGLTTLKKTTFRNVTLSRFVTKVDRHENEVQTMSL